MQPLRVYNIIPRIPQELEALWQLAHNYWFVWNNDIKDIFSYIDQDLWESSYLNPVILLNQISQSRLAELAADEPFKQRVSAALKCQQEYLAAPSRYKLEGLEDGQPVVAYFSLEFGLALCLPIYSGGLGILAGDHLKSASDLNVPLVAVGLAYRNGYFRQYMTPDGWQQERYPEYDFEQMPLKRAVTPKGEPAMIKTKLMDRELTAQIWEASVGRIKLYLLDTNIPENPPDLRTVTARLYGGNIEMRLWQEILLGIGGVKALEVLGIRPGVIHMNEGHSAFASLERVRQFMQKRNLSFEAATELAAAGCIFTTHTPVPAGNDRFPPELMRQYFEPYAKELGLAFKVFLALGREEPHNDAEPFCMTVLALRMSRFNNGVSALHGKVSRRMWHKIWNQFPEEDVPIGHITNGVHVPTWAGTETSLLYERFLGLNWREDHLTPKMWSNIYKLPDSEIWRAHERQRARLVDFVRMRVKHQLESLGARPAELDEAEEIFNPEALTIGFARRFATYKRANLLLRDKETLLRIVRNSSRPVQFIFAGKAHPHDNEGKQLMKEIITLFRTPELRKNMVFLEDYDMEVAHFMITGCDVWLNNPRRPLEASGTSGMKAMFNGVLQLSTLDGWWDEAWKSDNSLGWAIGKGEEYEDPQYQDKVEMQTIYQVLENDIIPEFYDRSKSGVPRAWVKRMKASLAELGPRFSSNRMVSEYMNNAYAPAFTSYLELSRDNYAPARALSEWRMDIMTKWGQVQIKNPQTTQDDLLFVGDKLKVKADVFLAGIDKDHMQVDIYAGRIAQDNAFMNRTTSPMLPVGEARDGWQTYQGEMDAEEAGRFGFNVRAMPRNPLLPNQNLGLIRWCG